MIGISFDLDEIMWMLVGYIKTKNWPEELLISSSICILEMLLLMSTCLILYATVGQWESLSKKKKAMMDQGVRNYQLIVGLKSNINSYFLRVSSTNQRNQVKYIYIYIGEDNGATRTLLHNEDGKIKVELSQWAI